MRSSADEAVVLRPTGGGGDTITLAPTQQRVADVMVVRPVRHVVTTTIAEARAALGDPHKHLLLIVAQQRLLGTVSRADLERARDDSRSALSVGTLTGRTIHPNEPLSRVHREMVAARQRRRAVVGTDGLLLGLLCLKSHHLGFCSDAGIAAR